MERDLAAGLTSVSGSGRHSMSCSICASRPPHPPPPREPAEPSIHLSGSRDSAPDLPYSGWRSSPARARAGEGARGEGAGGREGEERERDGEVCNEKRAGGRGTRYLWGRGVSETHEVQGPVSVAQEEMWGLEDHRWSGRADRPPVVERAGNGDGDGQPGKLAWAIHVSHTDYKRRG